MKTKNIQNEETYYLKDEVLEFLVDDEFGHRDFALVLNEIITKQKTPLNIGIYGKWGVGKSSIVSLYKKLIEDKLVQTKRDTNNSKKIAFANIPVWKYTKKESLRNKFMFIIAEALFIDIDKLKEKIYGTRTIITSLLSKPDYLFEELKKLKNFPWKLLLILIASLTVLIIAFLLFSEYKLETITDFFSIILTYILISVIPTFGKFLFNAFQSAKVKISYSKFDSTEEFENEFASMIENRKCKKIIFIDDLDRCSIDKVVETLETVKTFLDIPTCVFIIACDNKIIEQAIDESNEIYKKSEEKNGAQYLEKFFQYTIVIPPFIRRDMREYAKKILEKQKSKLLELPDIDEILFVLIHENVVNPRKTIVLINSFISDYLVIKKRENDPKSKLNFGTISKHLPVLAKLTVLKSDYPDFYSDLEKNKDLVKWMTAHINGEEELLEPYQKEKCKPYILPEGEARKKWDDSYWIDSKERKLFHLYNFLSATREYDAETPDIRPFLFLGQDSASCGIADEFLEKINSALRVGQILPIKRMLETEKREQKTSIAGIMLDWIENDLSGPELRKSIQVLSECVLIMPEDMIHRASKLLVNRAHRSGIKEKLKTLNINGMFFASTKVGKRQATNLVNSYIGSLDHEDLNFSKKILDQLYEHEFLIESDMQIKKVQSFLERREELENEAKPNGIS